MKGQPNCTGSKLGVTQCLNVHYRAYDLGTNYSQKQPKLKKYEPSTVPGPLAPPCYFQPLITHHIKDKQRPHLYC